MTYNAVLISPHSKVTQLYMYILFHILFHYGLSQDIEYIVPCAVQEAYNHLGNEKFVFYICDSISALQISLSVPFF